MGLRAIRKREVTTKTWRLLVKEFGETAPILDATLKAADWMSALRRGRKKLKEAGGVPPGASCAVLPTGEVRLHDPMARRTYALIPEGVDANPVAAAPAEAASHDDGADEAAIPLQTRARRGSTSDAPKSKKQRYSPPPPRPSRPVAADLAPLPEPEPPPAEAEPISGPAAVPVDAAPRFPESTSGERWFVLSSRDADPTRDRPLLYRERSYYLISPSREDAEYLLRQRFAELRSRVEEKPAGKLFQLAVFDHEWQDQPAHPPVATLQWKDWRGEPDIEFPSEGAGTPAPTGSKPPAPLAAAPNSRPEMPAMSRPDESEPRIITDEHDARLAHAFEASQDLLFLSTPLEALEYIVRLTDELIPCEAASACLYDINTDEFRFVALRGPGMDTRRGQAVGRAGGLMGAAVRRVDVALRVDDVGREIEFDAAVDARPEVEARNLLYYPLHHQGRLLGVLQLINRKERHRFTSADADVLAYIGQRAAEFLHRSRTQSGHPTG